MGVAKVTLEGIPVPMETRVMTGDGSVEGDVMDTFRAKLAELVRNSVDGWDWYCEPTFPDELISLVRDTILSDKVVEAVHRDTAMREMNRGDVRDVLVTALDAAIGRPMKQDMP